MLPDVIGNTNVCLCSISIYNSNVILLFCIAISLIKIVSCLCSCTFLLVWSMASLDYVALSSATCLPFFSIHIACFDSIFMFFMVCGFLMTKLRSLVAPSFVQGVVDKKIWCSGHWNETSGSPSWLVLVGWHLKSYILTDISIYLFHGCFRCSLESNFGCWECW